MYHYFAAAEIYNAIRIFIAAYVWMTGFGNFSYYYIKKDFSLARFAQVIYILFWFLCFSMYHTIEVATAIFTFIPFHFKNFELFFLLYADDVEAKLFCGILLHRP